MEMALVLATPHPDLDIHALFAHYNVTYFDGALSSCFVDWSSPRLTSSLATCNYQKGCCHITLSQPLLQCLSTDHVKNTLLHEMIHAYLFVTKNHRQHGTHGPEFREIMDSIHVSTKADGQRPPSGYKITLFHDFHDDDEVDDAIANYWECKKCGDVIKRATTAKPSHMDCIVQAHHNKKTCGHNDCRWHWHKVKCGGTYTNQKKVEERCDEKKTVSNGLKRLLGEVSLENIISENDNAVEGNSSATMQLITYQRNIKATSRSKLGSGEINVEPHIQEANMPEKDISVTRSPKNGFFQAKQDAFLPHAEDSSRTRNHRVQINKKNDLRGKPPSEKGKSPKIRAIEKSSPFSVKQFSQEKRKPSDPEIIRADHQKLNASEKKVETKVQTTRECAKVISSQSKSSLSPVKVASPSHRKPEFYPPNMFESCRKRKLTEKESIPQANCNNNYKVVSKWLEYYEDSSTDEEIAPLVNKKIIRSKRMRVLKESIVREKKEEQERKRLKETMDVKLLCLPGFTPDDVVDISDSDDD